MTGLRKIIRALTLAALILTLSMIGCGKQAINSGQTDTSNSFTIPVTTPKTPNDSMVTASIPANTSPTLSISTPATTLSTPTLPTTPSSTSISGVHITIYTDLQCHACYRLSSEVEPEIVSRYVNTGKATLDIRYVSILGPASSLAAQAVLCARDQQKSLQYRDEILSTWNQKGADGYSQAALLSIAGAQGLDTNLFSSCLVEGKYRKQIANNVVEAGKLNIDQLPTIFVNDVKIIGVQPLEVFVDAIEEQLAK